MIHLQNYYFPDADVHASPRNESPARLLDRTSQTIGTYSKGSMLHEGTRDLAADPPPPIPIQPDDHNGYLTHYCIHPDDTTSLEAPGFPADPIFEFDYTLDEFQRVAIGVVHSGESVMVSAHTGSGKTAIALYAIKLALSRNSRAVYTSPIKALSNQKYRELRACFGDVGLITGDVSINPNASCLVMTTEVLRLMLYRSTPLIRELSWVIYDEIHYMQDEERGVVWEESIIMLPDEVRFVFLSATIPNAADFSRWIATIHHQPCHVVHTEKRPVPLAFFLSPPNAHMLLCRRADGPIDDQQMALAYSLPRSADRSARRQTFRGVVVHTIGKVDRPAASGQIKHTCDAARELFAKDMGPVIIFCFKRMECHMIAKGFGNYSFTTEEEAEQINQAIDMAIEKFSEADQKLPQIEVARQTMARGIGVHHGGLLPLIKELIEILFQRKWIRVLIATETFAMGLNMPARSVLFHSLLKFDGTETRLLTGGEFIQMSGRAGRRGFDDFGAVVIRVSNECDQDQLRTLMEAKAEPLMSKFHLTHHMILSLLITAHQRTEDLIQLSFHQFQQEKELPIKHRAMQKAEQELREMKVADEKQIELRQNILKQIEETERAIHTIVAKPSNIGLIIRPGSIVKSKHGFGWGIAVSLPQPTVIVAHRAKMSDQGPVPVESLTAGSVSACFIRTELADIVSVATTVFDSVSGEFSQNKIRSLFQDLDHYVGSGLQLRDERNMVSEGLDDYDRLKGRLSELNDFLSRLPTFSDAAMSQLELKQKKAEECKALAKEYFRLKSAVKLDDLAAMRRVLERLGFVRPDGVVTGKGHAAAVITCGNELLLTEVLYRGVLAELNPQEIASLLCVFASEDKTDTKPQVPPSLTDRWLRMQDIENEIHGITKECGADEYMALWEHNMDPTYMTVAYNWACGVDFSSLMADHPSMFEGEIIRTLRRTDEVMRQAARAAKEMSESDLQAAILDGISLIRRDIVFEASLYV